MHNSSSSFFIPGFRALLGEKKLEEQLSPMGLIGLGNKNPRLDPLSDSV
jgi:hypothetical protein